MSTPTVEDTCARCQTVLTQMERAVIGKREPLEMVLMGILADGHVLLEDFPGLAKTLVARSFAQVLDIGFARVQFTPDLMPSDVTGSSIYRQSDATFEFRPGPVFTNLLLADEINRAPPKTQSALLEAMGERQVTIEGETRLLESPFLVVATQNPIEYEGTYPLPEAQLDRFLMRIAIGYPGREDEWEVLDRRMQRRADEITLEPVCTRDELIGMQRTVETVHVDRSVGLYMVDLVTATRSHGQVQVGASPRGTLALLKLARCRAVLDGRDFVSPDDVKAIAVPALGHRLTLRPELWVRRISGDDIVREVLEAVPTPAATARVDAGAVTRVPAAKLRGYALMVAALVWAAIALHRPELVAVAAPFGLLLAIGLGRHGAAVGHRRARRGRGARRSRATRSRCTRDR